MTTNEIRKWRERARWCIEQADATERDLPPRREGEAASMAEVSVSWLRHMAANITKSLPHD